MKLMLLDGTNLVHRAYYGIRPFTTKDGLHTNAVYGFFTTLVRLLEEEKPDGVLVALDTHAPTFRRQKYEAYKAQRSPMDAELLEQMPLVDELLDAMGVRRYSADGYEADDIIGTLSRLNAERGGETVVVSGDRDMLQLTGEKVCVKFVSTAQGQTTTKVYTPESFFEEYGFEPLRLIDLKALMGDSSDNIPGVPGIGKKGAGDLLHMFGTLDGVYENIDDERIKPAMRRKLVEGKDSAYSSYDLATIDRFMPLDFGPDDIGPANPDNSKLYALCVKLEFRSFIEKFGLSDGSGGSVPEHTAEKFERKELDEASAGELLALDGFAVAWQPGLGAFAAAADGKSFFVRASGFTREGYNDLLKKAFGGEKKLALHGSKQFFRELMECGVEPSPAEFDTELAAYLIDPSLGKYPLERVGFSYLGRKLPSASAYAGEDSFGVLGDAEAASDALCSHAEAVWELRKLLGERIDSLDMRPLLCELEQPLALVLAEMERAGMALDGAALRAFGDTLGARISELEATIYALAGKKFNINSTKLLGELLFETLGLPPVKKTKTGYSTDIDVLEKLRGKHPIIDCIIEFRQLTKLKSTYCDGLLKVIDADGRVRTTFNMTATATGRLSSTDPNLQNIPVRRELGSEIRRCFRAEEGCTLVDADYSQIELRLLAHIADDEAMIKGFAEGEDIHTITASQVFGVPRGEVTGELRRRAKAVNFGIVYGISAFSLADDLHVSNAEAKNYIDSYLSHYHGIRDYMERSRESAKELGYVTTLLGRRRYLPELKSKNFNLRSFGERAAMNAPIQGSAADVIKLAMLRVRDRLRRDVPEAKLVMQIHDELIVETPSERAEDVKRLLCEEMEGVMRLRVPLVADAASGRTWYDAKN